jgi:hypothetical protein
MEMDDEKQEAYDRLYKVVVGQTVTEEAEQKTLNGEVVNPERPQYKAKRSLTLEDSLAKTEKSYGLEQGVLGGWGMKIGNREYLHQFLIKAMHAGCNVEGYIKDEIDTMLVELRR